MTKRILIPALCLLLLASAFSFSAAAEGEPLRAVGSGLLAAEYYIPTSGVPISGDEQVTAVGDRFFAAVTTGERKVMGYWFSADGRQPCECVELADLSATTGNLSQPSVCARGDTVYVGWVALEDEAQNAVGGAQYLCALRGSTVGEPICVCGEQVWPRRPAMAAGDDGVLLVYRAYQDVDEFYGFQHQCYATYVKDDGSFCEPYRLNRETWDSIYPSVAYAKESGRFLVAWSQDGITGAIVTKETSTMPENIHISECEAFRNGTVNRPCGVASDGSGFLVTADYRPYDDWGYDEFHEGVYAVPVSADGTLGTPVRSVPIESAAGFFNGQTIWDGESWIVSWSCEKEQPGYWWYLHPEIESQPDFRYTDCYAARLNPSTLEMKGSPVGIGTGQWNQTHPRLAVGSGTLLCTYLDDSSGATRLAWCAFRGSFPEDARAELLDGGARLRRSEVQYPSESDEGVFYKVHQDLRAAFSGEDGSFWTVGGMLSRYADGAWSWSRDADGNVLWGDADLSAGGKEAFAYTAVGNVIYALGWSGFGRRVEVDDHLAVTGQEEFCIGASTVTGVWAEDADTLWAVNADGEIWRWNRDAEAERLYAAETFGVGLHAIHGRNARDVWAVGDRGLLLHWDGARWERIGTGVCVALNAVKSDGWGDAWVCGDGGTVLRVRYGVCERLERPTGTALYDLSYADPDCVLVCGTDDAVYRWEAGAWSRCALHRYDQVWDEETQSYVDSNYPNHGAVLHVFSAREGGKLRVIACSEPEEASPVYYGDLPVPAEPMLRLKRLDGELRCVLGPDVPESAHVLAARYRDGRMVAVSECRDGLVDGKGEDGEIAVFLVDRNWKPLCEAIRVRFLD